MDGLSLSFRLGVSFTAWVGCVNTSMENTTSTPPDTLLPASKHPIGAELLVIQRKADSKKRKPAGKPPVQDTDAMPSRITFTQQHKATAGKLNDGWLQHTLHASTPMHA